MKILVLDADGVMIEHEYFTKTLELEMGISHDVTQEFFSEKFSDCVVGKSDLKKEIAPYLKQWGWKESVDEFLNFWFEAENKPNKALVEYVKKAKEKGIKVVLATNQEKYRLNYVKKEMGFENLFDMIICSSDIGFKKPSEKFFVKLCEKLNQTYNVTKKDIIFWDDNKENVDSANRLEIRSFVYEDFEDFQKIMLNF